MKLPTMIPWSRSTILVSITSARGLSKSTSRSSSIFRTGEGTRFSGRASKPACIRAKSFSQTATSPRARVAETKFQYCHKQTRLRKSQPLLNSTVRMRWQAACIRRDRRISIPASSILIPVCRLDRQAPFLEACLRVDLHPEDSSRCRSAACRSFPLDTSALLAIPASSVKIHRLLRLRHLRRRRFLSPPRLCWSHPEQLRSWHEPGASEYRVS